MLYYIPGFKKLKIEVQELIDLGLEHVIDGNFLSPSIQVVTCGPDGGNGSVISFCDYPKPVKYIQNEQHWEKTCKSWWVGWYNDGPPKPDMLARKEGCGRGLVVKLSDNNDWFIPVARLYNGETPFACNIKWDGNKWVKGEILNKYKDFFDKACLFFEKAISDKIEFEIDTSLVVDALRLNYKISEEEISILGLFNTENIDRMLGVIVDINSFNILAEELKNKKKALEQEDSTVGEKE